MIRRTYVAILATAAICCSVGCSPEVYKIHGTGDSTTTINVLFVGDGFAQDDLPAYRAATHFLADGLMGQWPYCRVKDRMQFYRIDVVDDGGVDWDCSGPCGVSEPLPSNDPFFQEPAVPPVVSGSKDTVKKDLEVTRCAGTASCYLFWPSSKGMARAHALAGDAPNISIVVIVANSRLPAGGGVWAESGGSVATVVVGVPMEESGGRWSISEEGHRLFAHELGHGFGLLDEYVASLMAAPTPPGDRNVWVPPHEGPWIEPSEIPWSPILHPTVAGVPCSAELMGACCGDNLSVGCNPCSGVTQDISLCGFVSAECQDPLAACAASSCSAPQTCPEVMDPKRELCRDTGVCDKYPGAWEGAAYKLEDYYRASWDCRMRALDGAPFCHGCAAHLWNKWFCSGVECEQYGHILAPCT